MVLYQTTSQQIITGINPGQKALDDLMCTSQEKKRGRKVQETQPYTEVIP